jgi:hypothetical protein
VRRVDNLTTFMCRLSKNLGASTSWSPKVLSRPEMGLFYLYIRISEQTLDIDEELCACFIDWQKAFDHVSWTKLMQILKGTGIDWRERKLISKFYMEQSVKIRLDQGETRSVKL